LSSPSFGATNAEYTSTAASRTNNAGSKRRARRAQNEGRLMCPAPLASPRSHSRRRIPVIRKPERVKKVSRERTPPAVK
jgi:hypothetical protein